MGTFSIWHWLIVLVVVVLVFGSTKLAKAGGDLGQAIHDFRKSMRGGKPEDASENKPALASDSASTTASASAAATENKGTAEKSAS